MMARRALKPRLRKSFNDHEALEIFGQVSELL